MLRFYRNLILPVLLFTASACISSFTLPSAAQTNDTGVIDIDRERQKKILELEAKLKLDPDKPAKDMAIILQWLIELYSDAGRNLDVVRSYEKILSFFPYDVRIINRYAEFTLERLNQPQQAKKLLKDALAYGKIYNVSTTLLGNSHFLLAKVNFIEEDHEQAIEHLEKARFLFGEETPEPVIRLLAMNLHLAGKQGEAVDVLLELIGRERGSNPIDIEFLSRILPQTTRFQGEAVTDIVAGAVQNEIRRQQMLHESLGAEVVSISMGDTTALEGSLYRREGAGAVLFIPEIGTTRSAWDVFAQMAGSEGITALSIDLRGLGGSRSQSQHYPLDPAQPAVSLHANDIVFVLQYMITNLDVEEDDIVVVSEGQSCGAIEEAFHRGGLTPAAAYLSPFFDTDSRELYNAIAFRKDRPVLIMYSNKDVLAARSVQYFTNIKSLSQLTTMRLQDAGHGREALSLEPGAYARLDRWIRDLLQTQPH
jgi:tetratricopeptide (TPR) repeat protein